MELRTGNISQKSVALISYAVVAILKLGEQLTTDFTHAIHKLILIYTYEEYIYFSNLIQHIGNAKLNQAKRKSGFKMLSKKQILLEI